MVEVGNLDTSLDEEQQCSKWCCLVAEGSTLATVENSAVVASLSLAHSHGCYSSHYLPSLRHFDTIVQVDNEACSAVETLSWLRVSRSHRTCCRPDDVDAIDKAAPDGDLA